MPCYFFVSGSANKNKKTQGLLLVHFLIIIHHTTQDDVNNNDALLIAKFFPLNNENSFNNYSVICKDK